ncbi:MAG TPA: Bro-N domain-containing protein [archaeon]|jgi:prophage antirepressor-like protein|nr:Bro-N domain-containing protein [archaeon]
MQEKNEIAIFENKKIRRIWHEEDWWFSVVDVVGALTDSEDPRKYWNKLIQRLREENSEVVTNCHQLKLIAEDGKFRKTDCANLEGVFRIIQSIPSPKAEPFKLWLAKVGYQRIEENIDPELAINRAVNNYLKKGYSVEWVNQRLKAIEVRKELTDEWKRSGIDKPSEFASLTNTLTKAWSDRTVREYKDLKGLKKENLRDNMTNIELVLNLLAEATTTEISKVEDPKGFLPSENIAKSGGEIVGTTRRNIEKRLGKTVITSKNAKNLLAEKKKKQIT